MDAMHEICEKFKDELEEFARQDKFTVEEIGIIDKITHTIKSIQTVKAMEDHGYSYRTYGTSYRGGSYGDDMDYARNGNSRESGRRSDYTYNRGGRYSRDDSRDMLMGYAEKIMSHTDDDSVKRAAKMLIDELEKA